MDKYKELENDIAYFKNLGFIQLVEKFERDLKWIKELLKNSDNN